MAQGMYRKPAAESLRQLSRWLCSVIKLEHAGKMPAKCGSTVNFSGQFHLPVEFCGGYSCVVVARVIFRLPVESTIVVRLYSGRLT